MELKDDNHPHSGTGNSRVCLCEHCAMVLRRQAVHPSTWASVRNCGELGLVHLGRPLHRMGDWKRRGSVSSLREVAVRASSGRSSVLRSAASRHGNEIGNSNMRVDHMIHRADAMNQWSPKRWLWRMEPIRLEALAITVGSCVRQHERPNRIPPDGGATNALSWFDTTAGNG